MFKLQLIIRTICYWLACGFGVGLVPYAPGTVSTILVGVPLYISIHSFALPYYALTLSVATICGIYICSVAEQIRNQRDDSAIVWDEICGYGITMFYIPFHAVWIMVGVLLFRLFDILKPWPIRSIDQYVHGGVGIMLDDVLAGIYANALLHALVYFAS